MKQQERDELIARIDERVGSIQKNVTTICATLETHDKKLDKLESWKSWINGGVALLGSSVLIILGWLGIQK